MRFLLLVAFVASLPVVSFADEQLPDGSVVRLVSGHHILSPEESERLNAEQLEHFKKMVEAQEYVALVDEKAESRYRKADNIENEQEKVQEIHSASLGQLHALNKFYEAKIDYLWGEVRRLESCVGELEEKVNNNAKRISDR